MIVLLPVSLPLIGLLLAYLVLYWAMTPVRRRILGWRERARVGREMQRARVREQIELLEASRRASPQGSLRSEG